MFKRIRPLINMQSTLETIPTEWLRYIEPHVMRGRFLPCWIWMGATDKNGYPVLWIREGDSRSYKMVHRYVASLFYEFDRSMTVRRTCGTLNCVNPSHIQITARHHTQGY